MTVSGRAQARLGVVLAVLGVVAAGASGLWRTTLWSPTEPRVMEICREQYADNGVFGVPSFGGMPFLEKPPLYFSEVALGFALAGGPSVLVARLVTLSWVLVWLGATFLLVRRVAGTRAGALAAMLLLTTPVFLRLMWRVQIDVAMGALLAVALALFERAVPPRPAALRTAPWLGCAAAVGLASLCKGPLAWVLFVVPALTWAVWARDARIVKGLIRPTTLLLLVGPLLLWAFRLHAAGGGPYVFEAFINNTLGRFLHVQQTLPGGVSLPYSDVGGVTPGWYYLFKLPVLSGLSLLLLPKALRSLRNGALAPHRARAVGLALVFSITPLVLLSLSEQKGVRQVVASATGFALVGAVFLDQRLRRSRRRRPAATAAATAAVTRTVTIHATLPLFVLAAALTGAIPDVPALLTASLLVAVAGLAVALRARRHPRLLALALCGSLQAGIVLGMSPAAAAITDDERSLEPFGAWVAEVSADSAVGLYFDGDASLGALALALDGRLVPLFDFDALTAFLADERPALAVIQTDFARKLTKLQGGRVDWHEIGRGGNLSGTWIVWANDAARRAHPAPRPPAPFAP